MGNCSFDISELKELMAKVVELSNPHEIAKIGNSIVTKEGKEIQSTAKSLAPVSADRSKSGRWNKSGHFRVEPPTHLADAIPLKIKNDFAWIGWEKSDTSPYFYAKFAEWGTSRIAPHPFLQPALEKHRENFFNLVQTTFTQLVQNSIGA